jgi:hypothetical protein
MKFFYVSNMRNQDGIIIFPTENAVKLSFESQSVFAARKQWGKVPQKCVKWIINDRPNGCYFPDLMKFVVFVGINIIYLNFYFHSK